MQGGCTQVCDFRTYQDSRLLYCIHDIVWLLFHRSEATIFKTTSCRGNWVSCRNTATFLWVPLKGAPNLARALPPTPFLIFHLSRCKCVQRHLQTYIHTHTYIHESGCLWLFLVCCLLMAVDGLFVVCRWLLCCLLIAVDGLFVEEHLQENIQVPLTWLFRLPFL